MKINCEDHKVPNKDGVIFRCACEFLNRNWNRDMKIYQRYMKVREKEIKQARNK